jgi:polysaccharide biosynthesis/export protein
MNKSLFSHFCIISGFLLLSLLDSCVNLKKLTYFNTISKDSVAKIQSLAPEANIKKSDILQINIFTLDEAVNRIMNPISSLGASAMIPGSPFGYLVDESGIIKLPLLGSLKVEGLTKSQLSTLITNLLLDKKIAKDPVVTVRLINFQVTVLGEVSKPGVVTVPNERITLPEALGEAGDLTIFGKRDKILLIREVGGNRIYKRFDLNDQQAFDPDIYNLRNRDIIYVEPNRAKATSSDNSTFFITISLTIASFLLTIYGQLLR